MTFMHGVQGVRLLLLGNASPISSGHCYRGSAITEGNRLLTLRELTSRLEVESSPRLDRDDLLMAQAALSTVERRIAPFAMWSEEAIQDADVTRALGRIIELTLLDGSLQGEVLRNVINRSCVKERVLIGQHPDAGFGHRPIQQPPVGNADLATAIAVKVEPWLNLSEFLQTCNGIRATFRQAGIDQHFCDCREHPERYRWRDNVRRLHRLAQPFFGLHQED